MTRARAVRAGGWVALVGLAIAVGLLLGIVLITVAFPAFDRGRPVTAAATPAPSAIAIARAKREPRSADGWRSHPGHGRVRRLPFVGWDDRARHDPGHGPSARRLGQVHELSRTGAAGRHCARPHGHPCDRMHHLPQTGRSARPVVASASRQPERRLPDVPRHDGAVADRHDPPQGDHLLAVPSTADDRAAGARPCDRRGRDRLPHLSQGERPRRGSTDRPCRAARDALPEVPRGHPRDDTERITRAAGLAGALGDASALTAERARYGAPRFNSWSRSSEIPKWWAISW